MMPLFVGYQYDHLIARDSRTWSSSSSKSIRKSGVSTKPSSVDPEEAPSPKPKVELFDDIFEPEVFDPELDNMPPKRSVAFLLPDDEELGPGDEQCMTKHDIWVRERCREERDEQSDIIDALQQEVEAIQARLLETPMIEERDKIVCELRLRVRKLDRERDKLIDFDEWLGEHETARQTMMKEDEEVRQWQEAQARGEDSTMYVKRRQYEGSMKQLTCRHDSGVTALAGSYRLCQDKEVTGILQCVECEFTCCWPCMIRLDKRADADGSNGLTWEHVGLPNSVHIDYNDPANRFTLHIQPAVIDKNNDDDAMDCSSDDEWINIPADDDGHPRRVSALTTALLSLPKGSTSFPTLQSDADCAHRWAQTYSRTLCHECGEVDIGAGHRCRKCARTICTTCLVSQSGSTRLTA